MEWPISWNDVKNGLLPVVDFTTKFANLVTLSDAEGAALDAAVLTKLPIVYRFLHEEEEDGVLYKDIIAGICNVMGTYEGYFEVSVAPVYASGGIYYIQRADTGVWTVLKQAES